MISARDGYCDYSTWAPKEPCYGTVWQHCEFSSSGDICRWLTLSVTIHRTDSHTLCTWLCAQYQCPQQPALLLHEVSQHVSTRPACATCITLLLWQWWAPDLTMPQHCLLDMRYPMIFSWVTALNKKDWLTAH